MARLLVGLAVLVAATGFAPVPKPKPARTVDGKDLLKSLQGTWEMVSLERNVGGIRTTSRSTSRVRIQGNTWSYLLPNNVRLANPGALTVSTTYELKFDPTKSPVIMEMHRPLNALGAQAGVAIRPATPMMRGIVKVENDQLKFCYILSSTADSERPTSFETLGNNHILITLKRTTE